MNTALILLIYFSGFFLTWWQIKKFRDRYNDNTWGGVVMCFIVSLFSWLGFGSTILVRLINDDFISKPPKWM